MYGRDFRENTTLVIIFKIVAGKKLVAGSKMPKEVGILAGEFLCIDLRGLFLNASLRYRCSFKAHQICSTVPLVLNSRWCAPLP